MMRFWNRSLMARLVSYFLLLSLVIVALAGALAFIGGREALKQSVADRLQVVATLEKDQLRRWIAHQRQDVALLAISPEVQRHAAALLQADTAGSAAQTAYAGLQRQFDTTLALKPDLKEIFLLPRSGAQISFSTTPDHEGPYDVHDSFFTEGLEDTYVQNVYLSSVTLEPTLTISTPLRSPAGAVLGVLAVNLNLEEVDRIVKAQAGLGLSAETYLVDKFSAFISGERFGRERFPGGVQTRGVDAALRGENGWDLYRNYNNVPIIGVYTWVDDLEMALLVEVSQAEAFAPAERIAWTILGVGLLLAVALAVGIILLAHQLARPILRITDTALQIADGDLTARAPVMTDDEIGMLARTFNDMAGRLGLLYNDLKQEIAERQRAEEVRERLIDELEAKNAELERFTYTVSHDLKSPLVTIKGFLGMLRKDTAQGNAERVQTDIEHIGIAADKMQRLLNELLELSRVGRMVNPTEPIALTGLAHEAVSVVAGGIAERGVAVQIAPAMPVVLGDRVRLLEVYQNLIDNAVKFMGDQAQPCIEIDARTGGQEILCTVRDNGIGIAPEHHEQVFGLFNRLDHDGEGTGIGLALVKRIVEVHGGRIWVESKGPGDGSTFCFTLPLATEAALREQPVPAPSP